MSTFALSDGKIDRVNHAAKLIKLIMLLLLYSAVDPLITNKAKGISCSEKSYTALSNKIPWLWIRGLQAITQQLEITGAVCHHLICPQLCLIAVYKFDRFSPWFYLFLVSALAATMCTAKFFVSYFTLFKFPLHTKWSVSYHWESLSDRKTD